jgi:hypothetical protein
MPQQQRQIAYAKHFIYGETSTSNKEQFAIYVPLVIQRNLFFENNWLLAMCGGLIQCDDIKFKGSIMKLDVKKYRIITFIQVYLQKSSEKKLIHVPVSQVDSSLKAIGSNIINKVDLKDSQVWKIGRVAFKPERTVLVQPELNSGYTQGSELY